MKNKAVLCAALLAATTFANSGDYTVVKDDNLWNLSGEYLGDPYQWERIWNANSYIENPDLIYPGDQLQIPGRQVQGSGSAEGEQFHVQQDAPVTFEQKVAGLMKDDGSSKKDGTDSDKTDVQVKKTTPLEDYFLNRSDLYSVSTLRSAPYLLSAANSDDGDLIPGIGGISDESRQVFGLNSIVTVKLDPGQSVVEGERYDFSHSVKYMKHREREVNVVLPVGSGVATTVMGDSARIRITEAWDVICNGARIEPYRQFKQLKSPKIKKNVVSVEAKLLTRIDEGEAIKPFEVVILDSGTDSDIKPGDLFVGYHVLPKAGKEQEPCFRGVIVTVGDNSCAMIMQEVYKRVSDGEYSLNRYGKLIFQQ